MSTARVSLESLQMRHCAAESYQRKAYNEQGVTAETERKGENESETTTRPLSTSHLDSYFFLKKLSTLLFPSLSTFF